MKDKEKTEGERRQGKKKESTYWKETKERIEGER